MSEPAREITLNPLTWIERDEQGVEVTRRHICECGKMFDQSKIAFRFVEALAQGRGAKAADEFVAQTGGGWVPVLCPPCESRELGRIAERKRLVQSQRDNVLPPGDR